MTLTELHSADIAQIDNQRVDVITESSFLPTGTPIEVIADDGYRRVVRAVEEARGGAHEEGHGALPRV